MMAKMTDRDRTLLSFAPALLIAVAGWLWFVDPAMTEAEALEKRIAAAGGSVEAWRAPKARADQAAVAALEDRARAEAEYERALAELDRERGDSLVSRRSKPSALATLNRAAAGSGVKVVSAVSGEGVWNVVFLADYEAMSACLKALAEANGVMVRRIDRIPAEDGGARPIWKLSIEM